MSRMMAIARRETEAFFHSPMGPMVLVGFLVAVGLFFTIFLLGYSEMSLTALQSPRTGNYLNLAEGLFRPLVSNTVFFLLFLVPAITMRLFSPEYSSGRYDLIASWPVADRTWVLGKWLSALAVGLVMILSSLAYFAVVWFLGSPEIGPAAAAILGGILFMASLAAWGVLASAMFSHQMVAYFLAFVWSLVFFLVGVLERFVPLPFGTVAAELSLLGHFERFSQGVVDSRDILYFVLLTAVPLVIANAVLRSRRQPARRGGGTWSVPLLAVVLALAVYVLGQEFVWTADLTGNKRYSLAPQTQQILDRLPREPGGPGRRRRPERAGRRPGPGHGLRLLPEVRSGPGSHRDPAEGLCPAQPAFPLPGARSGDRTGSGAQVRRDGLPDGHHRGRGPLGLPAAARRKRPDQRRVPDGLGQADHGLQPARPRRASAGQRRKTGLLGLRAGPARAGIRGAAPVPGRDAPGFPNRAACW